MCNYSKLHCIYRLIPRITSNVLQARRHYKKTSKQHILHFNLWLSHLIALQTNQSEILHPVQENTERLCWFPKGKNWERGLSLSWAKETFREKKYCCARLMEEAERLAAGQFCVVSTAEKGFGAKGGVVLHHIHRDLIRITSWTEVLIMFWN